MKNEKKKFRKVKVIFFFFFIFGLIILSVFVFAQCHDVKIDEGYGINGIKIRYNASDITEDPAYLVIGKEYKLKSKIKNIGSFNEFNVNYLLSIIAENGSIIGTFPHSTSSLKKDKYKYMPSGWDKWNTSGFPAGTYTLIANVSISEPECNYSNNFRLRIVKLDYDEDNDGVVDSLDKCPNSKPGEKVDKDGCDPFQFCEPFYCSLNCFYADWKNNEPDKKYPNDCTVVIVSREGEHYPKCVPLTCTD